MFNIDLIFVILLRNCQCFQRSFGNKKADFNVEIGFCLFGGLDGTRTRDPLRDRQVF